MCILPPYAVFLNNPQINPTFAEDCIVIITKDYAESDSHCNQSFFKKNTKLV